MLKKVGKKTDLKLRGTCSTISKQEVGINEPKARGYASHSHDASVKVVNIEVGTWGNPKHSRIELQVLPFMEGSFIPPSCRDFC